MEAQSSDSHDDLQMRHLDPFRLCIHHRKITCEQESKKLSLRSSLLKSVAEVGGSVVDGPNRSGRGLDFTARYVEYRQESTRIECGVSLSKKRHKPSQLPVIRFRRGSLHGQPGSGITHIGKALMGFQRTNDIHRQKRR